MVIQSPAVVFLRSQTQNPNLAFKSNIGKPSTEIFTFTSVIRRKNVCVFSTKSKFKESKYQAILIVTVMTLTQSDHMFSFSRQRQQAISAASALGAEMKTPQLANDSSHFGRKWLVCGKEKPRLESVRMHSSQSRLPSLCQGESGRADGKSGMQRGQKRLLNKCLLPS